ncbi:unnamed protein product [Citrullus colocynthis]|uniref:Organ-specific protein S2-like n=1 Tax=Citrullus colocynthis TaxID=252529 RepID=A0ABP0Y9R9_9ROSI
MKGLVFINVLLLVLFAISIESRHEPGEHHWRNLINHKLLFHEANKDLIRSDPSSLLSEKEMDDCTETLKVEDGKLFVEPGPQAMFYRGVVKAKLFAKDIKPRPDNTKTKFFVEDVEPRPNVSFYPNEDVRTKLFVEDIEPRPNVSFYPDNDTKTKLFVKNVEPRPNISFYPDDDTNTKLFVEDIEPRPNVSFYPDNLKAKDHSADDPHHHGEADIQMVQA